MTSMIKKLGITIMLAIPFGLTVNAQTSTMWKLDKSHTSVNFSINHFFSAVTGRFNEFDGNFNFDPANVKGGTGDFTIQIGSVNTDDTKRDKHLQSADFFDSKSYPAMAFKSTRIEQKSKTEFTVYGKLTIKNTTKDIEVPITVTGQMEHPMMKGTTILGLSSSLKINRNDYGVGSGDWASDMVVGNEVRINIYMELNAMK